MVEAPTFLQREQWQVPIMDGSAFSSNLTAPQQQLAGMLSLDAMILVTKRACRLMSISDLVDGASFPKL
jgi:hypothetical protein